MWRDPIVEEVRRVREQHAARFDYDLSKICQDLKQQEKRSRRKVVSLSHRRRPGRSWSGQKRQPSV
jgi:hypothetical protein